jgi:hypothetical protein
MQSKQPSEVVIRYDLMVLGLGYNASYYHNMNIVTWSCYNTNIGYVHHGIYQMAWSHCQLNINVPWSRNLNHQLTNEPVLEVY